MQGLVPGTALPRPLPLLPGPCLMCRLPGSVLIRPASLHPTASDSVSADDVNARREGCKRLQDGCRGMAEQMLRGLILRDC